VEELTDVIIRISICVTMLMEENFNIGIQPEVEKFLTN